MAHFEYIKSLKIELDNFNHDQFSLISSFVFNGWRNRSKFWVIGNGGNSANALHFVTDWTKGLYLDTGVPMSANALVENSALFSALSNDLDRNDIFSFQIQMHGKSGDIAILMSAGGNSQNVASAAEICKKIGITTIGIIGGTNPKLKGCFDYEMHTVSDDIQIVEDIHSIFGHMIMREIIHLNKTTEV